jgi:Brp/Blh family beta-carotene 15,15'-monooxygenase
MTAILLPMKSIGAVPPPRLRLWALPFVTGSLIVGGLWGLGLDSIQSTMIAAVLIVICGIPHGTLDAEIAATYFGQSTPFGKSMIILGYVTVAALMLALWATMPELALVSFLIISIVHFSKDWRDGADPFLAMMVGWALVAAPALSHPEAVGMIFELLTGNQNGSVIAALLACTSVPAILGSLVFSYWVYKMGDVVSAFDVISCIVAGMLLPPLVAFAIFFCGLHSPRHMADAMRDTGMIAPARKAMIMIAVFALSIGLGVMLYLGQAPQSVDSGLIQTAFILISTLTAPHFALEHMIAIHRKAVSS